jgi:uncharacterized protein with NRDE domain
MCLILVALKSHPLYKLIIAGNRDEFFERPTAQATFWEDVPDLLAGKDLRAGGTWFGITKQGRIAAITDYRDPALLKSNAPSRGELVRNFLLSDEKPLAYINGIAQKAHEYNGYNLIAGNIDELYWFSNLSDESRFLKPHIYGLSNRFLDTPWPKVVRAKTALQRLLSEEKYPSPEQFFSILSDRSIADDKSLPDTGVEIEWERMLSPIFVTSQDYGTRSSTILLVDQHDRVMFVERTFAVGSQYKTAKFEFQIESCLEEVL